MKKTLFSILLLAAVLSVAIAPGPPLPLEPTQACTCDGCQALPVNNQICIDTPSTIAPPACAIPKVVPPKVCPPQVNIPTIDPPCINVPIIIPPCVIQPPTITPPKPVTPVVCPPPFTPPTLPPQIPITPPVLPVGPIIHPPTPPTPIACPVLSNQFTLTFQYACRESVALQSCLANVIFNDVVILSIVPTDYSIQTVTLFVIVVAGRNKLQFEGAGISDSYGLGIDNVRFVRAGTTVNIAVNGDFELPNQYGSWGIFNDISGWRGVGIEIGFGTIYNLQWNSQVCELDGNTNYQITQFFTFDSHFQLTTNNVQACNSHFSTGQTLDYTLEFDWAVRTLGSPNFDTSKADILWNNIVIDSLLCDGTNLAINHAKYTVKLHLGDNTLQLDGTSFSDSYGISIDNVKLYSACNSTNLIVNGDFSSPFVGTGWQYIAGGIPGWKAFKAEIGGGNNYNNNWPAGQCIELDSDSNQRYTQVITIHQQLFNSLYISHLQYIGNNQATQTANLAINNAVSTINHQVAAINSAIVCQISLTVSKFNHYLNQLYHCTNAAVQNMTDNQYLSISQYSCASSQWIQYFGQSGESDFTCDANDSSLSHGFCVIIAINGKVVTCGADSGNYHLQVSPCSHFEGQYKLPQIGHKVYWKGSQGSTGNIHVTVATTCNC